MNRSVTTADSRQVIAVVRARTGLSAPAAALVLIAMASALASGA